MGAGAGRRASRCPAGGRTQEASLDAGSLCLSAEYRSQAGEYLRIGEPAAESKGGKFARRDGCAKAARRKSPKEGLSPLAWKSRKRRGIPTFPQPLRRLLGYIFNVSIAVLRVTSLNVLTRKRDGNQCWRGRRIACRDQSGRIWDISPLLLKKSQGGP